MYSSRRTGTLGLKALECPSKPDCGSPRARTHEDDERVEDLGLGVGGLGFEGLRVSGWDP